MWCVIATEFMLFVCMFGSYYYLGTNKDRWATENPPKLMYPFILLAILLAAALFCTGVSTSERGTLRRGPNRVLDHGPDGSCLSCAAGFRVLLPLEELTPYSDSYGSIFYTITTLHAAHVIVGLLMLSYVGILPRYGRSPFASYRL